MQIRISRYIYIEREKGREREIEDKPHVNEDTKLHLWYKTPPY
jgi:hypothetical protein